MVTYAPRPGDVMWRIPSPPTFGFVFASGADPGGDALPVAVVTGTRNILRPVVQGGVTTWSVGPAAVASTLHRAPRRGAYQIGGEFTSEASFCRGVWAAWCERAGLDIATTPPPSTVDTLAGLVGWERVS